MSAVSGSPGTESDPVWRMPAAAPDPREPRRAGDPAREPGPPPRRFGPSRLRLEQKRADLRASVADGYTGPLREALPPSHVPTPDTVPVLRLLARRALFSVSDQPGVEGVQRIKDLHGTTILVGQRLSWQDLRTLTLIFYMFRHSGGLQHPTVRLAPATLGRMLRGERSTQEAIRLFEASLRRLRQARFCLLDADGNPEIGTPDDPVSFLEADERPRAHPHDYRLRGWLHERLRAGFEDPRLGLVEFKLAWPLLRVLRRRALLLYLWLECEAVSRSGLLAHPIDRSSSERFHRARRPLCPEFLVLLGLGGQPGYRWREELRRASRVIWARDGRYEFLDIGRDGEWLEIWKRPGGPQPDLFWTGRLCARCQRPDPHGVCCCKLGDGKRCGDERCQRCQEHL